MMMIVVVCTVIVIIIIIAVDTILISVKPLEPFFSQVQQNHGFFFMLSFGMTKKGVAVTVVAADRTGLSVSDVLDAIYTVVKSNRIRGRVRWRRPWISGLVQNGHPKKKNICVDLLFDIYIYITNKCEIRRM